MKKILMLAGALIISAVSFADLESTIKNHYSNKTIDLTVVSKPRQEVTSSGAAEMPAEDENSANADVVESGTQATADVIEKVNFYLRNNPEKLQKLEKHYRAVVGQE